MRAEQVRCKCGAEVESIVRRDYENVSEWVLEAHYAMSSGDHALPDGTCAEGGGPYSNDQVIAEPAS